MGRTTVSSVVVSVCNNMPKAANNEALLLALIWDKFGWDYQKDIYSNLKRLPHPETVSRARRIAYNKGLIKYSDEAVKTRTKAFINERDKHSSFLINLFKRKER